jgi:hypothetical protein
LFSEEEVAIKPVWLILGVYVDTEMDDGIGFQLLIKTVNLLLLVINIQLFSLELSCSSSVVVLHKLVKAFP